MIRLQNYFQRSCVGAAAAVLMIVFARHTSADDASGELVTVIPRELPNAVLHNPDMGWVLYENYPLDQDSSGSSTLLTLPNEEFASVDAVAIMFSWQDIEQRPDEYNFSKADFAYDYWAKRGKEIQLRLSAATLMWWSNRNPPAGCGVPDYVRSRLSADEKQTREMSGTSYDVEDVRNSYYRERLTKFLQAVDAHFSAARPVTLIDLRGFGAWGEWHSGFKYERLEDRRTALKGVIDLWCDTLPNHQLALSYSYDPDSPKELYAGSTRQFEESATGHYREFLDYSAFDYALTKANVTFRRDGCGGAVHSNERKLNEEAFRLGRGPMFSEFVDGYAQSKAGGQKWVEAKIEDALSLHPNYVCLLGWQGADTVAFLREQPDLVDAGLRRMGYRLVPTKVEYPGRVSTGTPFEIKMDWVNRGVGRALRDYELRLSLLDDAGHIVASAMAGKLETSRWAAGETYPTAFEATFENVPAGKYELAIGLRDEKTGRNIELPLDISVADELYRMGGVEVATDRRHESDAVK